MRQIVTYQTSEHNIDKNLTIELLQLENNLFKMKHLLYIYVYICICIIAH